MNSHYLVLFFIEIASILSCTAEPIDKTVVQNEGGRKVVHAVLTKLEACQGYNLTDHRLLRRIAFVQTEDNGTHDGGIWAVDEAKVDLVSDMMREWLNNSCRDLLNHNQSLINDILRNLTASTDIPIVSGLAASLYLQNLTTMEDLSIPLAGDIDGQARFWYRHYYTSDGSMNVTFFQREVKWMERMERCRVNADVVFVMDISHSIEDPDLIHVRDFMRSVVDCTNIGQDNTGKDNVRFGTVLFGRHDHEAFNLEHHKNKKDLLHAISEVYNQTHKIWEQDGLQPTNIAAGLCGMYNQFKDNPRPPSSMVYRVAIVMTDGRSQNLPKYVQCGKNWTIDKAVKEIRKLDPPVLVYVIGVSNDVDENQLMCIATDKSRYMHVNEFLSMEKTTEDIRNDICWKETMNMNVNNAIDEHLNGNEVVRYNLLVPGVGITVQFCVTDGKVYMYGSVSYSTPNSALNDFMLVLNCSNSYDSENCSCGEQFIDEEAAGGKKRVRREATTTELYITIEGDIGSSRNAFVLNVTEGDVPTDCVGELIASDCGDNTSTHHITSNPGEETSSKKKTVIIAATVSSTGLILICYFVILSSVAGWVFYQRRKQRKHKEEDEYTLLDDENMEI